MIGCIGAGVVIAGGVYLMDFYSPTVSTTESVRFRFSGLGLGLGGNLSSFALPGLVPDVWCDIPARMAFNGWDLNGAEGAIGNAGVGVGVNVGVTNMLAQKGTDTYFDFNGDVGISGGFGAGISGLRGVYRLMGTSRNIPSRDDAYIA